MSTTMRRVRLDELCATKNCAARANQSRSRAAPRGRAVALVTGLQPRHGHPPARHPCGPRSAALPFWQRRQRRPYLALSALWPCSVCGSIEHVACRGFGSCPSSGGTSITTARQPPSQEAMVRGYQLRMSAFPEHAATSRPRPSTRVYASYSLKRYPTPYSVSIMSKSLSLALNFLRRRLMWLSMVRSST